MKQKILLTGVLIIMVFSGYSLLAQFKPLIRDTSIKLRFVSAPDIQAGNVEKLGTSIKVRWLKILLTYTPVSKRNKINKSYDWLDDMSIKYELLLPSTYRGKNVFALLSGKVTYWSVEMDGTEKHAVAFISPKVLKRYARSDIRFKRRDLKKFMVRITFYNKSQLPIGRTYYIPRGISKEKVRTIFKNAEGALGILKLPNTIFGKDKTPWANIDFDAYELIKIEGRK